MSEPEFEITKEDVEGMLRFLRFTLPEHATPEKAIFLLDQYKVHFDKLEELYPEVIEEKLKDFESH